MVTRRGTLLEKNVEKIFKIIGFNTKRNYYVCGYELDVYACLGNFSVAVQCKQYEQSTLNVRDVIHQWDSKNKKIKANKIIIMIYGQDIAKKDVDLGKELGITVLGEPELDMLEELIIKNDSYSKIKVFNILGINEDFKKVKNDEIHSRKFNLKILLSLTLMFISLMTISLSKFSLLFFFIGLGWIIYLIKKR